MEKREAKTDLNNAELNIGNVSMLGKESQAVKYLPGFVKPYHQTPKNISGYHESWIQKIAQSYLDEQIDEAVRFFNESLNYKRRDLEVHKGENGQATLLTKDFDYMISVSQSQEKADWYLLTKRIFNFKNREIIYKEAFNNWFANALSELCFAVDRPLPIGEIIDRVEDHDNREDIAVDYRITDLSECTIRMEGIEGQLRCDESAFSIILETAVSPETLVQQAEAALDRLAAIGMDNMLAELWSTNLIFSHLSFAII